MRIKALKFYLTIGVIFLFSLQIPVLAEEAIIGDLIKVGSHMDLSGPLAPWGISVSKGIQCYFNRVNEEGGVFERRIVFLVEDDASQPIKAIGAVKTFLEVEHVFSILSPMGTATSLSSMPFAREAGIPFLFPLSGHEAFFRPLKRYVFSLFTHYDAEAEICVDFLVQDLGFRKIGIVYQNDDFGAIVRRQVKRQLKKHGLSIVSEVPVGESPSDLSLEIQGIKKKGCEAIVLATVLRKGIRVLKVIKRADWDVALIGMRPIDPVSLIDSAKSAAEGLYVSQQLRWVDSTKDAGVVEFRRDFNNAFPGEPIPAQSLEGYRAAKVFIEALKRAGKNLARDKIVTALETLRAFDDGVGPPITFTKSNHLGSKKLYILQIKGGRGVAVTEFREPIR